MFLNALCPNVFLSLVRLGPGAWLLALETLKTEQTPLVLGSKSFYQANRIKEVRWKLVLKLEQPSGSSLPFAPGPYISLLNFITIKMGKAGDNWGSGCQVLIAATSCAGLLWHCREQHCNGLYFPDYRELKERFSNMADKNLSGPIPDGWSLEIKKKKDGSKVLTYICPGTGQCFSSYEDMMRYVIYAKNAELPVFVPNFPWWQRNQNAGQSSESADDQIEQNLDLDKGTDLEKSSDSVKGANIEKYLDPEKGTDIEKSLISKKGTDAKSLDSEKSADAGENLKPQNIPSDNLSAPAADTFTHEQLFFLQQIPNVPPVPVRSHGEEKSPLVAIPPAMIQEFAAANPRPRPGASKPRRFRRWGHKKSAAGRYN